MRTASATFALALLALVLGASAALGSPATVNVRIEGKSQTLFEGPIRTEGHEIEASSDVHMRPCDGTNGGAHLTSGPTPTAAGVDAMNIAGETFDGQWFPGYDDYLISRWGPDEQNAAENEYWGLLVDQILTPKGGCQIELAEDDRVLWVYGASSGEPFLTLSAGSDSSSPPSPTATATLGQPFAVEVGKYTSSEGTHHDLGPYNGAEVAPVSTAANGFQTVEGANPSTVTTDATGGATIIFTTPGWHRLKATATEAIRSNRLDVCVPPQGTIDCGPLPLDDQVRPIESSPEQPVEPPAQGHDPGPEPPAGAQGPGALTGGGSPFGGSGTSGGSGSSPAKELRLRGLVLAPIDDRAGDLTYGGRWRLASEPGAWLRTVSLGARNATLTFRLAAGRPVVIVRDVRRPARVAIVLGRRRQVFTIPGSRARTSRLIIAARRAQAGAVQLRVLKGTVGIDGVALTP